MSDSTLYRALKFMEMNIFMCTHGKEQRSTRSLRLFLASCLVLASTFLINSEAAATITLRPSTWNIVGLDSNSPATGPRYFPVGAKVCSDSAATNVAVDFNLSASAYISQRSGSLSSITFPSIAANTCVDAFFEVEVTQTALAFDTSASYTITAGGASTPLRRELYVEHLVSQSRNSISNVKLDGVSIAPGGGMNMVVGNTYTIDLIGGTATQGYNQFEAFINFPNTIFQILSVSTNYSALSNPACTSYNNPVNCIDNPNKALYADSCGWENDTASPNYRSCILSDNKGGGNLVTTTYVVKILSGGGTSQPLNTLLYDFSGSSYHYNADYSTGTRIATITDPAATNISKAFSPSSIQVGGISTLTFTLTNPNSGAVSGLEFTDTFPVTPGNMTYVSTVGNTCGGTLTTAATGITLSGATVAANSSCIVQVRVTADTASGTNYTNTSGSLLIKTASSTVNTGKTATAQLTVTSTPSPPTPPSTCTTPVTLATWTMPTSGQGSGAAPPPYTTKASDVSSATASFSGTNAISTTSGNPVNSWGGTGWASAPGTTFPSATTAPWFNFVLDTSKYGGVRVSFDYAMQANGDWQGPADNRLYLYTQADAGAFSTVTTIAATKGAWQTGAATTAPLTATTTGTGTTTFRFNGTGAGKPAAILHLDNIIFTGCPIPNPPTMTKAFSPGPVAVGGTSTLTFTITNPNANSALSGIAFTDTLPQSNLQGTVDVTNGSPTVTASTGSVTAFKTQLVAGSIIFINGVSYTVSSITSNTSLTLTGNYAGATASGLTITAGLTLSSAVATPQCNGGTMTGSSGGRTITLAGGTIAAGAGTTCTITATVKDSIAGPINNVSGPVSHVVTGTTVVAPTAVATATLTAVLPPVISKKFAPNPILATGTSTLTFLITNPNQNDALNSVAFTDTFPTSPANMTVASPATFSTSGCGTPTFTPVAGAGSITFTAGTIAAAATCTVTVRVTAATLGSYVNTSGNVSHLINSSTVNGNTATDTLVISAPDPAVGLLKEIAASSSPSVWGYYLAIPAGNTAYYQLSVFNDGDVALSGVTLTDPTIPAASITGCSWKNGDDAATTYPLSLAVANNSNNLDFAYCILSVPTTLSGTVSVSGTAVTGSGSSFTKQVAAGDLLLISGVTYSISSISSDTALTLATTAGTYSGPVYIGWHKNTATASVTYSGSTYTDTDWAIYAATGLTLVKSATSSVFGAAGSSLGYSYLVTNSGAAALNGPVSVTDDKATVTCPAVSTVGNGDNFLNPNESITCTATYTVTAGDVTAKSITNKATASTPSSFNIAATTSNESTKTVPLASDLVAIKTNTTTNGSVPLNSTFKWVITVANNTAAGTATFTNGQALLVDELPTSGAAYLVETLGMADATGTISCAVASNTLTCTASGTVTLPPAMTGTISVTSSSVDVVGSGTTFTTQFIVGSTIIINGVQYAVASIQDNNNLKLKTSYAGVTASGVSIPTSFSVPVKVTPSAAGSLSNPKASGVCKADPNTLIPELDETNNSCSNTVTVLDLPSITLLKSYETMSDPINATSSPKTIPGAVIRYTIQAINSGNGAADNNSIVVTDPIPANTVMCVSTTCRSPPVVFTGCSSSPSCGLSLDYATNVTYSNQVGGGIPYDYTVSPDVSGYDSNVTGVRINPTGVFSAASGGNNATFSLQFRVKIK